MNKITKNMIKARHVRKVCSDQMTSSFKQFYLKECRGGKLTLDDYKIQPYLAEEKNGLAIKAFIRCRTRMANTEYNLAKF